jgi:GNAT superfamily N-acetyltransferase
VDLATRKLEDDELTVASKLLARAFVDDPVIGHYLDDPDRKMVALPSFFEGILAELLPSRQTFATVSGNDVVGVAAWVPPNPTPPDESALAHAHRTRLVVLESFPHGAPAMFEGFASLEALHPPEPHWYLAFVGIEPGLQGAGLGRRLLAPALRVADETATSYYLETPFPRSHSFYEGLGFARYGEYHPFDGCPSGVVAFIRRPR